MKLSKEKGKELFEKRKYYSEHPEEAKKSYAKRNDGIGMVAVDSIEQEPKKKSNVDLELYLVMDDTSDIGKDPLPFKSEQDKKFYEDLLNKYKKEFGI